MKALVISADHVEDAELFVPYYHLQKAGVKMTIASLTHETITGKQGYELTVDKTLDEINPDDYAILILPGGKAPALVRKDLKALEIARIFSLTTNRSPPSATGRRS